MMFVQPILDRAEVRAVAPALADVERRLAEIALLRIELAQVGQVIDPALLGARADVEVHALDRLQRADRVLAALQDVMHGLGLRRVRRQHLPSRPGSHQHSPRRHPPRMRRPCATW